jgi:nicotinate-nucleotide adenylyltransferase
MSKEGRIAILGGTFDPITLAHVSILVQAASALGAGTAWLVPTHTQPLRPGAHADVHSRLALVRAAVEDRDGIRVIDDEALREGTSYTIDTLDALEREHTNAELWWVMGADAARTIQGWHRAADLLARGRFALVNRSGTDTLGHPEAMRLGFRPDRTRMLMVASPLISSTDVRERVARGEPVAPLVGERVAALIMELGLYRRRGSGA